MYVLFDHDVYVSPFSMKLLGQHFITLGIEGFVFFFFHVALECFKSWQVSWTTVPTNVLVADEDSDVAEERLRVSNESSRFDIMRVMNVTKKVKGLFGTKAAVDGVSFAIGRGECFGLLGVNGAGKTTLFRILTGQIRPTSGKTIINRMSISRLLSNSSQVIGYCPQADALDEVLSPRQHLTVYAELRGVPSIHISRVVADSLSRFQLVNHADVSAKALSRGTRRKLCLAIAMLGSPQIVLLVSRIRRIHVFDCTELINTCITPG
jgi:ABC-type Na+ transport system ATPase subunit NatA